MAEDVHDPDPDRVAAVTKAYTILADSEFRGYSALYDTISRALLATPDRLAAVAQLPGETGQVPMGLFAAVHDIVLREPDLPLARIYAGEPGDPWPPFRDLLDERADELAELMRRRGIQTNEVGRSALLVPAMEHVRRTFPDRPIALVEIGPSAGLNLVFDHYGITYSDGRVAGDPTSTVQLACTIAGPTAPPLPATPLPIVSRQGIDRAPIDLRDPDASRWLEACVWPDVPDRLDRLRAAMEVTRADPPSLVTGDIVEQLPRVIDAVPGDHVPVVVSTWVLAYLDRPARLTVKDLLAERGALRDLALLTGEYPTTTAWVPAPARPAAVEEGKGATLLAMTWWRDHHEHIDALAWVHAHGQWLDWLADGPGTTG